MTESSSHTSADLTDEPDFDPDDFGPVTAGSGTASVFRMAPPTTGEQLLSDRASLQRVAGLSTELEDVTEVEYRQLRLERVVLVGVWTEGHRRAGEGEHGGTRSPGRNRRFAGSRRSHPAPVHPDAATYIGSGKADELREVVLTTGADTVICDGELTPGAADRPGEGRQVQGHRPHRADPGHLRPARHLTRG